MAHPEQNEREFITAALRGWGYRPLPAATLQEAARRSPAAPALQLAIVDRTMSGADLDAWRTRRVAERAPPAADDPHVDGAGRSGD